MTSRSGWTDSSRREASSPRSESDMIDPGLKDPLVEALTARAADLVAENVELKDQILLLEYEVRQLQRRLAAHDL